MRDTYLCEPWCNFSIATHDFVDTTGGADLPIILPSQQAQESWHQKLVRTLMAKLRQPLETVLVELLPKIALRDTTSLPEKLLFTSDEHLNTNMVQKAIMLVESGKTMLMKSKNQSMTNSPNLYYVLRVGTKLTKAAISDYNRLLLGLEPRQDKAYLAADDGDCTKGVLVASIRICQSMHCLFPPLGGGAEPPLPPNRYNPAKLVCTCKAFRKTGICSHLVAATAFWDLTNEEGTGGYDLQFLKALLQPTSGRRAAHRPTKTKKALTQQPAGDVVSAEEEDSPDDGWDSAPDDWAPDALASGNNKPPLVITAFTCIHMHIPAYVAL